MERGVDEVVYFTFVSEFNAIHRLWNADLSDAENRQLFGECANEAGHGHRYRIEITVAKHVGNGQEVVINRAAVRDLIASVLAPKFQHADLDKTFGCEGFVSTGENVTRATWRDIEANLSKDVKLSCVKLIETPKNSFSYFGENDRRNALM